MRMEAVTTDVEWNYLVQILMPIVVRLYIKPLFCYCSFTFAYFGIYNINYTPLKMIGASDEQVDVFNEVWYIMLLNIGEAQKGKILKSHTFLWCSNLSVMFNCDQFKHSNWSDWEANQEERWHPLLVASVGMSWLVLEPFGYGL